MSVEDRLLDLALSSACDATADAGRHTSTASELLCLNEQWSQSYIGLAINDELRRVYNKPQSGFVTFETSVAWIDDFIGPEHRSSGPIPGKLSRRQRFDIAVWSKGGLVAGLIEIKDQPIMHTYSQNS